MSRIRSADAREPHDAPHSNNADAPANTGAETGESAAPSASPHAPKSPASTRAARKNAKTSDATAQSESFDTDFLPAAPATEMSSDDAVADDEMGGTPEIEETTAAEKPSAHREFDLLFERWQETGDPRLRERLILMNRSLVSFIARRFNDRGEMSEDLIQQGLIGLINALDHFDPKRGVRFATFATPTIMGEIRRYFRDRTWSMRVPRRLQELNLAINNRVDVLTQELGRSPTYAEIARSLNLQIEEIVEALEMTAAVDPISIDEEVSFSGSGGGESSTVIGDQIGVVDTDLENADDHAILAAALAKLSARERQVLELAYFEEHSQIEIARRMNVSQMFVSRLQRRALAHLRDLMGGQEL